MAALGGCKAAPTMPTARATDPRADFRPTPWQPFSREIDQPTHAAVRDLLCAVAPSGSCDVCLRRSTPTDAARCALEQAYAADPDAATVANELLSTTGAIAGVETETTIDASYLGKLPVSPVIPAGPYRHHLVWVRDALTTIEATFAELSPRAPEAVLFRTRPNGFRFYRTREKSYPSAYAEKGIVGYNVEGPLHDSPETVLRTLFHEIFHLNDEGHGRWSGSVLTSPYEAIIEACDDDHECLKPFAADDTVVPNGTYYAFDSRTRDVREYAAEVALRYFIEHRTILAGEKLDSVFKCAAKENETVWRLIVHEFFGGLDLTPPCPKPERDDQT